MPVVAGALLAADEAAAELLALLDEAAELEAFEELAADELALLEEAADDDAAAALLEAFEELAAADELVELPEQAEALSVAPFLPTPA